MKVSGRYQKRGPRAPFRDVHPSRSGHRHPLRTTDLPDSMGAKGNESRFTRCLQCGYPVDRERHSLGSGWGNITHAAISGAEVDEPTTGSGCPFCGSSNYDGSAGKLRRR